MVTTRKGAELVRRAKEDRPGKISVETSPKYLLLTEEDHVRQGPFSTVLPRFKTRDDNEAIWDALKDGTIDMVATDHAPHARPEKEAGYASIWAAPTGVPEVELSLPLMLSQVSQGRLTLPKLVALMAVNPAREYGIYPQKGVIQVGSDADIVMVDMGRAGAVDDAQLVTAPKYSAFHGYPLRDGVVLDSPPHGKMVRPRR
jgi:dihydroorotase